MKYTCIYIYTHDYYINIEITVTPVLLLSSTNFEAQHFYEPENYGLI